MKLTRRGIAVVAIFGFALLQGYVFGERTLDYVAGPALIALAVGGLTLWRAETPTLERSTIRPGFPGEERRETVSVEGSGVATVVGPLPDGIEGDAIERTVSLPFRTDRKLLFRERGVYVLDPITVRQRDPLGLVTTAVEFDTPSEAVVYPEIDELDRTTVIGTLLGETRNVGFQSFEWLREYQNGDPLRRIHWKSTAKHEEFLVVDSTPSRRTEPVDVVVDGRAAMADELATAAASLVFLLLDSGLRVSLTLPDDRIADGHGYRHREHVLDALAALGERSRGDRAAERYHLSSDAHNDAEVLILGDDEPVSVRLGADEFPFDQLRSGSSSAPATTNVRSVPAASRTVTDG